MNLRHTHTDNLPGIQKQILLAFETDITYNDISGERCNEPTLDESAEWIPIDLVDINAPTIVPEKTKAGNLVTTTFEAKHACCAIEKLELLSYMKGKKLSVIYITNNGQKRLVKKAMLDFSSSEGSSSESGNVYNLKIVSIQKCEPQYITGIAIADLPPIVIAPPVTPPTPTPTILYFDDFVNGIENNMPKDWHVASNQAIYRSGIASVQNSVLKLIINGSDQQFSIEPIITKHIDTANNNLIGKQIKVEFYLVNYSSYNSRLNLNVLREATPERNYTYWFGAAALNNTEGSDQLISAISPAITADTNNIRFNIDFRKYSDEAPYPNNDFAEIGWCKISIVP